MTSVDHNREGNGGPRLVRVPLARTIPTLAEDVARGLLQPPRRIPPKYFYDARGSELFDAICETPEYYPTRIERSLLESSAGPVMGAARPDHLLELGSGSSSKTRVLLEAWPDHGDRTYWPFDVSQTALAEAAQALQRDYPWLAVTPLVGDYSGGFAHLPPMAGRVLVAFLGGTIGNFPRAEAVEFLQDLRAWMDGDDALLIGLDRVKDPDMLVAAYDDPAGVTAEFNLNVLRVLNRELGADFDLRAFRHEAVYEPELEQIEMYLVARSNQTVRLKQPDATLEIAAGERILTEISRKFTKDSMTELLESSGFSVRECFQPDNGWYSLVLAAGV